MSRSSLDECYALQLRRSGEPLPWSRSNLNTQFLAWEKGRAERVIAWREAWLNQSIGTRLPEIALYVTSVRPHGPFDTPNVPREDYEIRGLRTLRATPSADFLAIFSKSRVPKIHSLIRIDCAYKDTLYCPSTREAFVVIRIEQWTELPAVSAYDDLPRPRRQFSRLFFDLTHGNTRLASMLEGPMVGAPSELKRAGGISIASFSTTKEAARVTHALEMMVASEFRTIRPPESAERGVWIDFNSHFSFHYADVLPVAGAKLETAASSRGRIVRVFQNRRQSAMDYSTVTSLLGGGESDMAEVYGKFSEAEVVLSKPLDKILDCSIIENLWRNMEEDLPLVSMSAREIFPDASGIVTRLREVRQIFEKDIDVLVSDHSKRQLSQLFLAEFCHTLTINCRHQAMSYARARGSKTVTDLDLKMSVDCTRDNLSGMLQSPQFISRTQEIQDSRRKMQSRSIEDILRRHPRIGVTEIWQRVGESGSFESFDELSKVLEAHAISGLVFSEIPGTYSWTR